MSNKHLFVDISSHGFGHLGQVAPVLNALIKYLPELKVTVRSGISRERLAMRLVGKWQHIEDATDFGFVMNDAVSINHAASLLRYQQFHQNWLERVEQEAGFLAALQPDLVLTDVAYLPLAGAGKLGIPSLSMSSLNWADLFGYFYNASHENERIFEEILSAYQQAARFLRLTPAMNMPFFENIQTMPPVALLGKDIRTSLIERTGIEAHSKIMLVAFGGFDKKMSADKWPQMAGIHWLIPQSWGIARPDMSSFDTLGFSFSDLIKSVDVVLTKPGYGTFVEAACNATAVLYVPRENWPEQDCLIAWLNEHARCQAVSEQDLMAGLLEAPIRSLLEQETRVPVKEGAEEVARFIAKYL